MMDIKKYFENNKTYLLLILILIISFFIRAYGIQSENVWSDEAFTIFHAHQSVLHNIEWSLSASYFPLYHAILSSWEKIFGLGEFSVRFLSLIFGVLSIYLVFKIGTFMFNKKVGIYSAIILALSSYNVFYSQEARVYTLFVLLSLCSIYFYLRFIQSRKKTHMVYYILFTFLMLNTHSPAIFILIAQNMHYLLFVRRDFKKWILMQSALFIFFLPLLLITLSTISEISGFVAATKPNIVTLLRTFYMFSAGQTFRIEALVIGSFISIGFFLLLLPILFQTIKDIKNKGKVVFLLLWLTVPILLTIIQSYVFHFFYFENYVITSSIALYILIALSITRFNNKVQMIIMTSIVILSLMTLYIDFETNNKGRWKDTADYIKANKNDDAAVVIHIPNALYSFAYYFDSGCFKSSNLTRCMSMQNIYGVKNAKGLPIDATDKEKVFLVLFNAKYIDKKGTLLEYYSENYRLTEEKKYRHIQIFTFNKSMFKN
jgi:4-amino-4-deoxy-L-arabinose transferase-like glycosyltransferase